jgi:hypothetical protein
VVTVEAALNVVEVHVVEVLVLVVGHCAMEAWAAR